MRESRYIKVLSIFALEDLAWRRLHFHLWLLRGIFLSCPWKVLLCRLLCLGHWTGGRGRDHKAASCFSCRDLHVDSCLLVTEALSSLSQGLCTRSLWPGDLFADLLLAAATACLWRLLRWPRPLLLHFKTQVFPCPGDQVA